MFYSYMMTEALQEQMYEEPYLSEEVLSSSKTLNVKLPYIIKNKILMSPGVWNDYYYSKDAIRKAYSMSDFSDPRVTSLFLDHKDEEASEWVGSVKNIRLVGDSIVGDLEIVDPATAFKLAYGAKFGISPKVEGEEENNVMREFIFKNFSVVINPAVKTAYINAQLKKRKEVKMDDKKELAELSEITEKLNEILDLLKKKKKYPYPEKEMQEEEDKDDKEEEAEAETTEETEAEAEETEEELKKKKKKYPYPYPEELSASEFLEIVENSAYTDFIKKYLKTHKGATIKEAAAAWKKEHSELVDKEIANLKDQVKELSQRLEKADRLSVKLVQEGRPAEVSVDEANRNMLRYIQNL